jgi:serine/threonine protein kinase
LHQAKLKGILQQILLGMQHIHSKWFLHHNLKASSILVHHLGHITLCNFGLVHHFQDPPKVLTQLVVTLRYQVPQLMFGEDHYGPAIDMFNMECGMHLWRPHWSRGDFAMQGQDDHQFPHDGYTCMIQLEYIAIGNQPGEIHRNGKKKVIWQLKRAEIVLFLYLFGN